MDFGATGAERRAIALMLLSAFLYSLVPVWVGFGNAGASPFFFTAIAHLAAIPMILFYVHRNSGWDFFNWKTVKAMFGYQPRNRIFLVYLFLLGICTTSYAFFSMASKHLEYSNLPIVAAIYEAWPTLVILAFLVWPVLGRNSRGFGMGDWLSLFIALLGLGFVISAREAVSLLSLISNLSFDEWGGIILAFISSLLATGIVVLTLAHGQSLSDAIFQSNPNKNQTINCTMLIVIFMHISGFLISAALGLVAREAMTGAGDSLFALGMGVTIGFGAISFRVASIQSENPGITALSFLTPLFALGILLLLGWFDISEWSYASIRWDYLFMGATAILSANILLNLRADVRTGYRSLVLCLWVFGAFRYLYGGLPWPWYYESIAVVTGILAIAVGFRSERFVRRSQMEEALSIDILHSLTWLIDKYGSIDAHRQCLENARGQFLRAHSPEKAKTMEDSDKNSHMEMVKVLSSLRKRIDSEQDQETISKCLRSADELILSRAHGNNFGEKVALFVLAMASAGISLVLRSPFSGEKELFAIDALVGNFFSILIGPVAIFLYFHVVDLERDRSQKIYDEELAKLGDLKIIREIHDRSGEKRIASTILIVTFVVYAGLFLVKLP